MVGVYFRAKVGGRRHRGLSEVSRRPRPVRTGNASPIRVVTNTATGIDAAYVGITSTCVISSPVLKGRVDRSGVEREGWRWEVVVGFVLSNGMRNVLEMGDARARARARGRGHDRWHGRLNA
jgi:hypothetical protein